MPHHRWPTRAAAFDTGHLLAHTPPALGYLSPTLSFDTLIDRLIKYASFTPANDASGSPAISLPLGADNGLPIGVQLAAVRGARKPCWSWLEIEQARPWRRIQAGLEMRPGTETGQSRLTPGAGLPAHGPGQEWRY